MASKYGIGDLWRDISEELLPIACPGSRYTSAGRSPLVSRSTKPPPLFSRPLESADGKDDTAGQEHGRDHYCKIYVVSCFQTCLRSSYRPRTVHSLKLFRRRN